MADNTRRTAKEWSVYRLVRAIAESQHVRLLAKALGHGSLTLYIQDGEVVRAKPEGSLLVGEPRPGA